MLLEESHLTGAAGLIARLWSLTIRRWQLVVGFLFTEPTPAPDINLCAAHSDAVQLGGLACTAVKELDVAHKLIAA
jgi:hypothetical protein